MPVVMTRSAAAILLLVVLVAFLGIAALPHQISAIRIAGLSLLWWFGGVIAPVLAAIIAIAWLPGSPPPARSK
jgi:uncharacterized membrane protein YccF (DUF307 family)